MAEAGLRQAKPTKCARCGADTLTGDDDDKCAFHATVDIEPTDRLGEVFARIERISTYDIRPSRGRSAKPGTFELYSRYGRYGHWDVPVLIHHVCNRARP